jgi:hypothetical protein
MENKTAPPWAVQGLHFQAGVARKTERSEGTPGVVTKICIDLMPKPSKLYDLLGFVILIGSFWIVLMCLGNG